ncbi:hypothetical protein SAMD00079811_27770 [Scytonema sp. HK-05]|uniref:hypothetical protein n=1 Tax=Scytonema sp. HK-05 TaxID=1137095 RepID=UPI000937300F|nr:hypothetical protein [Scytonema sp. HK-05]OKH60863.1 hypothetical protein NIES2130_01930 [Scytonema sp. HK-05]BAY45175.1 hypothetical protein SAMD00079811_27770 [Scytonema sp. HK-05]
MESPFLSILVLVAAVLLVGVTGGVGYLTLADWRDRRLREQEKRETRSTTPKNTVSKKTDSKKTDSKNASKKRK